MYARISLDVQNATNESVNVGVRKCIDQCVLLMAGHTPINAQWKRTLVNTTRWLRKYTMDDAVLMVGWEEKRREEKRREEKRREGEEKRREEKRREEKRREEKRREKKRRILFYISIELNLILCFSWLSNINMHIRQKALFKLCLGKQQTVLCL